MSPRISANLRDREKIRDDWRRLAEKMDCGQDFKKALKFIHPLLDAFVLIVYISAIVL